MSLNLLLLLSLILFQQSICDGGSEGESGGAGEGESSGATGTPTKVTNNCGMVQWNQPTKKEDCTEISLVDGYCCFVKFKGANGASCIRQGEIDEDNKNEITDEMRKAVNRLKPATENVEIESVQCKGYYIAFYGLSLLLLAVML